MFELKERPNGTHEALVPVSAYEAGIIGEALQEAVVNAGGGNDERLLNDLTGRFFAAGVDASRADLG